MCAAVNTRKRFAETSNLYIKEWSAMLKPRRFTLAVLLLAVIGAVVCVFVVAATRARGKREVSATSMAQTRATQKLRNVSLQPEARKLGLLLGSRFLPASRSTVTTIGTLTIGTNSERITIARRQTANGEAVEILSGSRALSWNDVDGRSATVGVPTPDEDVLLERLVFDGPEQFVLAQLRGASYYTIARNVRPEDAGSDYNGPLWTIVRVNESQQNEKLRPVSVWRLYYINTGTGLIDRVVTEINRQTVEATILSWNMQNGQRIPGHITWSVGGRVVMDYYVTNLSYSE
jgi:hypothetical protein